MRRCVLCLPLVTTGTRQAALSHASPPRRADYAAKGYGWPRTYRRILELNKAVNGGRPPQNAVAEKAVRELTAGAIR